MSKPKTPLNRKANERVKLLISENKITQRMFANSINYTEQHISKILREKNPAPVSLDTASRIAEVYSVRTEWVMGMDDYRTNMDYINAQRERDSNITEGLYCLFEKSCKDEGIAVEFCDRKELAKIGIHLRKDSQMCYVIIRNNEITGLFSLEEYLEFKQEILNYSSYLIHRIERKAKSHLLTPIPLPEDLPNG